MYLSALSNTKIYCSLEINICVERSDKSYNPIELCIDVSESKFLVGKLN